MSIRGVEPGIAESVGGHPLFGLGYLSRDTYLTRALVFVSEGEQVPRKQTSLNPFRRSCREWP